MTDNRTCGCGHPHIASVGDDGADAGCSILGKGCECWEWHESDLDWLAEQEDALIERGDALLAASPEQVVGQAVQVAGGIAVDMAAWDAAAETR